MSQRFQRDWIGLTYQKALEESAGIHGIRGWNNEQ